MSYARPTRGLSVPESGDHGVPLPKAARRTQDAPDLIRSESAVHVHRPVSVGGRCGSSSMHYLRDQLICLLPVVTLRLANSRIW